MAIVSNKRAYHDYFIEEKYEAGIELKGTEVKSIKLGKASIQESYVRLIKGEVFILGMFVESYKYGNRYNLDERRTRKLLLNRAEIKKLTGKVTADGYTLVPISVYLKKGMVKLEIAIGKGKKEYDKREVIAQKTQAREIERELKSRY